VPDDENASSPLSRQVERALARYEHAFAPVGASSAFKRRPVAFLELEVLAPSLCSYRGLHPHHPAGSFQSDSAKNSGHNFFGGERPSAYRARAEEIIKQAVARRFSNGENLDVQRYQKAQRILKKRMRGVPGVVKKKQLLLPRLPRR